MRQFLGQRTALYAYIRSVLRDDHRAEDVLQNVCLVLLRKHDEIQSEDHMRKWLRTTARYESLRVIREGKTQSTGLSDEVLNALESEWDTAFEVERGETIEALKACIERLTPYAKQLITLRYHEGLTGKDLADRVGRRINTIYVALTRAHRHLSECVTYSLRESTATGRAHE
ncbi:sigma-70 family RNA polymerase sigma factor [Mucisphaera calidilacus]|uniref:RNA polymerase sigma factor n=1 Tax=Mucisphaera calidilacus TaxID=2527982 RepID=A0A518BU58_9BACT|nr:sigma-70 family RNA polymerase sigma factor [Mucisphaera calidilacus]QDU70533.1 RNA polymerase sigma factor [Mucisphaera calidilacus]